MGVVLSPPAHGQKRPEAPEANAQSARDPASIALRDKMMKAYHDLHAIHEKITQRQWKSSREDALTLEIDFRYRKPNRLYLAIDYPFVDRQGRWQLVYACDGKTLTVYNGARNEYEILKSPAHLDRLLLPQALRGPEFTALLRDASPFDELEKAAIVRYAEAFEETTEGSWHTLKLELQQDGAKRTLRYRLSPKDNLVRGFTLSILPDADTGNPFADPEVRSNVEARYSVVDTNPRFTEADFHFNPPGDAKEKKTERPKAGSGRTKGGAIESDKQQ
jgi:hypothetical protein